MWMQCGTKWCCGRCLLTAAHSDTLSISTTGDSAYWKGKWICNITFAPCKTSFLHWKCSNRVAGGCCIWLMHSILNPGYCIQSLQKTLIILKLLHIAQQTGSLVAAIAAVVVAVSRLMHSITARDANDVKHSLFLILSEPRPALTPHLSPPNQSQQVLSRHVSRVWRCPEWDYNTLVL